MQIPSLEKTLKALVVVLLLAAAGYLGLSVWAGFDEVLAALGKIPFSHFAGMLLLSFFACACSFLRWKYFLHILGAKIPLLDNLKIYAGCLALGMTPARSGELLRGVFLKKYKVEFSSTFAAFAAERSIDVVAMALLTLLGLYSYAAARPLVLLVFAGIFSLLILLNIPSLLYKLQNLAKQYLPNKLQEIVLGLLQTALDFRTLFHPKHLLPALGYGLLIIGAEGLGLYLLLQGFGLDLSLATALSIYSFSLLAGALSFMPGGLGGFEAAMIALLTFLNMNEAEATAITLLIRVGTLWLAVLIGLLTLPSLLKSRKNC